MRQLAPCGLCICPCCRQQIDVNFKIRPTGRRQSPRWWKAVSGMSTLWCYASVCAEHSASTNAVTTPAWSLQCPRKDPYSRTRDIILPLVSFNTLYLTTTSLMVCLLQVLDLLHNRFRVKAEELPFTACLQVDRFQFAVFVRAFISDAPISNSCSEGGGIISKSLLWCSEGKKN